MLTFCCRCGSTDLIMGGQPEQGYVLVWDKTVGSESMTFYGRHICMPWHRRIQRLGFCAKCNECVSGDSTRMRRRKPSSCAVGVKVTHQYRSPLSLSELFWTWCFHGVFIMCRTEIFCTLSPFLSPAFKFRVASRRLCDRSTLKSIELKIDLAWSSEWFWWFMSPLGSFFLAPLEKFCARLLWRYSWSSKFPSWNKTISWQ